MTADEQATNEEGTRIVTRSAVRPSLSLRQFGLHRVVTSLTDNFDLVRQLTVREVLMRYKGSFLGMSWSFALPMLMLVIYTFVFTVVFEARWEVRVGNKYEFALILFAGLIVFQIFSECISRAPTLLSENTAYIKRVVFPLEALAWVVLFGSVVNALISFVILSVAHALLVGPPSWTILWLPVVMAPFLLMVLGGLWFLASLGLYVRDVRQIVAVAVPVLMFASPVFYPLSALPESFRPIMALNPLAVTLEQVRQVLLYGVTPDAFPLVLMYALAIFAAWAGLAWFLITKRGFADAI